MSSACLARATKKEDSQDVARRNAPATSTTCTACCAPRAVLETHLFPCSGSQLGSIKREHPADSRDVPLSFKMQLKAWKGVQILYLLDTCRGTQTLAALDDGSAGWALSTSHTERFPRILSHDSHGEATLIRGSAARSLREPGAWGARAWDALRLRSIRLGRLAFVAHAVGTPCTHGTSACDSVRLCRVHSGCRTLAVSSLDAHL